MGLLKKLCPAVANADTLLYTVPDGKRATVMLNVSSRAIAPVNVGISVMDVADVAVGSVAVSLKGKDYIAIPAIAVAGECSSPAEFAVTSMSLVGANIIKSGEGYAVDDVITLTVTGGVASTVAKIKVTAVSGTGGVTGIAVDTDGVYTTIGTVSTIASTTGTGTGASFEGLTWGVNAVSLVKPGNGYKTNPVLTLAGGSGVSLTTQMIRLVEADDYFEPETVIMKAQPLERTGIPLSAGQSLYIKASMAGVINAHVFGVEVIG